MHGSIYIILYQPLADQYGVLIIVALPCHKADQWILAQRQLSHGCGRAVRDDFSRFHMVSLEHDGFLVVAVGLIASGKLGQVELCLLTVVIGHADDRGGYIIDGSGLLRHHADAGVHGCLGLHAGTYHRRLR